MVGVFALMINVAVTVVMPFQIMVMLIMWTCY